MYCMWMVLDSLGRTFDDMAQGWQHLTRELQVDVVVLEDAMDLTAVGFECHGALQESSWSSSCCILTYSDIQQRRSKENQREGIDAARRRTKNLASGVKLGLGFV